MKSESFISLEEFVRDSLLQITRGASSANAENSNIAPSTRTNVDKANTVVGPYGNPIFMVDFDVAVTASRDTTAQAGAKVGIVSVVSGKFEGQMTETKQTVSRISFSIPVIYKGRHDD